MQYDPIWDKIHEECGVLGIYDKTVEIPRYIYWGLFALQHRGQESGGMALTDGTDIHTYRGMGLISSVFEKGVPEEDAIRRRAPIIRAIFSLLPCIRLWVKSPWPITGI